jgi:hypothetical protein
MKPGFATGGTSEAVIVDRLASKNPMPTAGPVLLIESK